MRIGSSKTIIEGHSLEEICSFLSKTKKTTKISISLQYKKLKKKDLKKILGSFTSFWFSLLSTPSKDLSASILFFTHFGNTQYIFIKGCSKSLKLLMYNSIEAFSQTN
jgi:hypothetical protein